VRGAGRQGDGFPSASPVLLFSSSGPGSKTRSISDQPIAKGERSIYRSEMVTKHGSVAEKLAEDDDRVTSVTSQI
jgi:hypothetical protein